MASEKLHDHPFIQFDRKDIRELVGPTIFERGEDYYDEGMVRDLSWEGGTVKALVLGSSEASYSVSASRLGGRWRTHCTCPYDRGVCKHVAATLLAALEDTTLPGVQGVTEAEMRTFISGLSQQELAELVCNAARNDPRLYNRLGIRALTAAGRTVDLAPYRRRIEVALAAWDDEVPDPYDTLAELQEDLCELGRAGHPAEAAELLEALIDGCTKAALELEEAYELSDHMIRLYEDWGWALGQLPGLDRKRLAHNLMERIEQDELGLGPVIVLDVGEAALGDEGLAELEALVMPKYEEQRRQEAEGAGAPASPADDEVDYRSVLLDICQARGDFDRYIVLWEEGAHHPMEYLGAVHTLIEAGRPADALRVAERVSQLFHDYADPMLPVVHLDLLAELGRGDEAPAAAWAYFRARPASDTLDLVLSHVPEGERQAAREQALGHLLTYGKLSEAIESFIRGGEVSRLAQALEGRREELFDLDSSLLEELAGALPADHLDLAVTIYRKVAMDILEGGSSVAYHRAAACLGRVKKLLCGAQRAAEWSKLRDEVRAAHHRKRQFMKLFERL